jgi:hypothetical protein
MVSRNAFPKELVVFRAALVAASATCKSSQTARGADLRGGDPSAGAAAGGN